MTEQQHRVLETISSGPESIHDLWRHLKATMCLQSLLDALWALSDAKQAMFVAADGMWHLR